MTDHVDMARAFKWAGELLNGGFLSQYKTAMEPVWRMQLLDEPHGLGALYSACSAKHRAQALGTSDIWIGRQFSTVQAAHVCAQLHAAYTEFAEPGRGFSDWSELSFERMLLWYVRAYGQS